MKEKVTERKREIERDTVNEKQRKTKREKERK